MFLIPTTSKSTCKMINNMYSCEFHAVSNSVSQSKLCISQNLHVEMKSRNTRDENRFSLLKNRPPQSLLDPDTGLYWTEIKIRIHIQIPHSQSAHNQSPHKSSQNRNAPMKEEQQARVQVSPLCAEPQLSSSACRKWFPIVFSFL